MDVFDLFAKISLDTSEYEKGLSKASKDFKDFSSNLKSLSSNMKDMFSPAVEGFKAVEGVGKKAGDIMMTGVKGFMAASTAVAGFGGSAVSAGMSFDAAMSQVSAISGATGSSFDALRKKAIEMGAKTQFSATEAAEAMNYMAMAGWKDQDMLNGIAGIMNLAAASGEDLASTSDIVTDALTAFGMTASESGRFADILAVASSNANTNVGMMGETFKYVAPVAGSLGYSAEDTALAIGLMANSGIKASQAGTSLRSIITRLSTDAGASSKSLGALGVLTEELGVQFYNTDGTARSLNDVIMDSREAWHGLSEEQQVSYAKTIAGQEAMSAWLALMNAAPADVEKLTGALTDCDGAAEKMAATMMDNLAGDMKLFKSALESLQITVSDALNPTLRQFAQFGTRAMEQLTMGFQNGGTDGFFTELSTIVTNGIYLLSNEAPKFAEVSLRFIESLATGILNARGQIVKTAETIISNLIDGIDAYISGHKHQIIPFGLQMVDTIFEGFSKAGSVISKHIGDFIPLIVDAFLSYHKTLFTVGIEILGAIGRGLVENKDKVRTMASETIRNMAEALIKNAPDIIDGAIALLEALTGAISDNWPLIVEAGAQIIGKLVEGVSGSKEAFAGVVALLLPHLGKIIDTIGNIKTVFSTVVSFITGGQGISKILSVGKTLVSGISKLKTGVSALTSVMGILSNPVTAIIAAVAALAAGIIYLWNTNEDFRNAVKGIWDAIVGFFQAAGEKIQQAWSAIVDFFQGVWDGIVNIFQNVGQWFSDVFSAASQGIQNAWQGVKDFFQGIWDAITGVFEGIGEFFSNLFGGAWETVKETTSNAWEGITTFLGDTWEGIKTTAGNVFDNVKEGIGNAWEGVKKVSHTVWDGVAGWLSDKWGGIQKDSEKKFDSIRVKIGNVWLDTKDLTTKEWGQIYDIAVQAWMGMEENSASLFGRMKENIHKNWEAADDDTKKTWKGLEIALDGTWAGLEATSKIRFDAMQANVKDAWEKANTSTNAEWPHIVTAVSDGAFAALTAVGDNFGQMKGTVEGKLQEARTGASNVSFYGVGESIVSGMAAGVNQKAYELANSVANAANMALEAARKAIQSNSPSKVFRKKIGWSISEGMAVGVEDKEGMVVNSILSITDSIQKAFNPDFAMDFPTASVPVDFAPTHFQYASPYGMAGNRADSPVKAAGNTTVNIYSPVAVDAIQAAREWKKTTQKLAMGF